MSLAIPLTAALAILLGAMVTRFIHTRNRLAELFLGLYGCCSHGILTALLMVQQGRETQWALSTTPTLFTPLQAIYTRPSEVAAIFRTVPPPDGIFARANFSVLGLN